MLDSCQRARTVSEGGARKPTDREVARSSLRLLLTPPSIIVAKDLLEVIDDRQIGSTLVVSQLPTQRRKVRQGRSTTRTGCQPARPRQSAPTGPDAAEARVALAAQKLLPSNVEWISRISVASERNRNTHASSHNVTTMEHAQ